MSAHMPPRFRPPRPSLAVRRANMPHGYHRYRLVGCSCVVCRSAFLDWEERVEKFSDGHCHLNKVPVGPVQVYLERLFALGYDYRSVSKLAKSNERTLENVRAGKHVNTYSKVNGRTRCVRLDNPPPLSLVRVDLAARILAVPLTHGAEPRRLPSRASLGVVPASVIFDRVMAHGEADKPAVLDYEDPVVDTLASGRPVVGAQKIHKEMALLKWVRSGKSASSLEDRMGWKSGRYARLVKEWHAELAEKVAS